MQKPCQHRKISFLNSTKISIWNKMSNKQSFIHKRSTVYLMSIEKKIKYKKKSTKFVNTVTKICAWEVINSLIINQEFRSYSALLETIFSLYSS